jgi:signal transduction histidine kinase
MRVESQAGATGSIADLASEIGLHSLIATPVVVEGRPWGQMGAGSTLEQPLPADAEARLASFTELVATAIANADSRTELMTSRARIIAAADESRRRIERDLHDGTQQQLVSLMLQVKKAEAAPPSGLQAHLVQTRQALAEVLDGLQEIARDPSGASVQGRAGTRTQDVVASFGSARHTRCARREATP